MRSPVPAEAAVEYGLFSRHQARAAGYSKAAIELRIRRGEWIRLERGLLRSVDHVERVEDALLRAVLRAGPSAVACGLSAASVLGWGLFDQPTESHIAVPRTHGTVEVPGARVRRTRLTSADVAAVGVLPVTTASRTALDVASISPAVEAVVAVDSALRLGQVTLRELHSELRSRRTMPNHRDVLALLGVVDSTSGSVPESLARLLFRDVGLPEPQAQYEITCDGRLLARVDFAWPRWRLVVEIDGFAWHSSRSAMQHDLTRQNDLVLAGWTVLRFTADDIRHRPAEVATAVARAMAGRSTVEHN